MPPYLAFQKSHNLTQLQRTLKTYYFIGYILNLKMDSKRTEAIERLMRCKSRMEQMELHQIDIMLF